MNFRKNLILLLVLVAAALFVFFIERPFEDKAKKSEEKAGSLFPALKLEEVKKLEITRPKDNKRIILQKVDQSWVVAESALHPDAASSAPAEQAQEPKNEGQMHPQKEPAAGQKPLPAAEGYPADQDAVKDALDKLQSLREDNIASRNKEKHALLEVAEGSAIAVAAFNASGQELARMYVGKEGPDLFSNYFRKAGSDLVYLHSDFLKGSFDRQLANWRNRKIFDFAAADVSGITIAKKKETVSLKKGDAGEWRIEQPVQADADGAKVTRIVTSLSTLTAGKFADEATPEQAGLTSPEAELTVTLKDGSSHSLLIGAKQDENYYYVKVFDQQYIYEAYKSAIETLMPSLQDLKKKEPGPEAEKTPASEGPAAAPAAPRPAPAPDRKQ